jgi:glutamine synthetase
VLLLAEYIWMDGAEPTPQLRSKARVVSIDASGPPELESFPQWSFDGSSTYQADGGDSDLTLEPVRVIVDPIRGAGHVLVLCEVVTPDGAPHVSNTRARLRSALASAGPEQDPWVGFEQEYTLFAEGRPLGFPINGYPAPQGPYYCAVGVDRAFGRTLVEAHAAACLDAGLMLYGINGEVMPGQWEFQIGYRGVDGESADPLTVADHVWLARWLLQRLGEDHGIVVSFAAKPMKGDWNGAGAHTNFSTRSMRRPGSGLRAIHDAISQLSERHDYHIANYGDGLADRLTGHHETARIDEFRGGVADRGASIRIPRPVQERGHGYLEDRRPGASCDPYRVCTVLVETVCGATAAADTRAA